MTTTDVKTGDLVLCKVGSFPPWPAVVFPQRLLRKDVYRKRKQNCVAVCFFNDPTYYWEQPHRLRPLERTMISYFLKHDYKTTTQKDLIEAYRQAQKYSNLKRFIKSRFNSEDRIDDLNNEENENGEVESGEDPFLGKKDDPRNVKDTTANNKNGKKSTSSPAKTKNGLKVIAFDSDGKEESDKEFEHNEGYDAVNEREPHIHYNIKSSNRSHSRLDRSRRIEIAQLFRRRLQKNLIQRNTPPTHGELQESHKLLNKIYENTGGDPPFFDLAALKQSKLHKLLKVITNTNDLEEFHPICKDILLSWSELIREIKAVS